MLVPAITICPVCSSREAEEFSRFPEIVFSKCLECRTIYRSAEDLDKITFSYDEEYFAGTGEKSLGYARRFERRVRKACANILLAVEAAACRGGPVLDIGCSVGYVLEAARRLGLEATGVDASEFAVAECRRRGYDARLGDIARTGLPDGIFQVAILKHILEHTQAPRRALEETARVLAPGGAVYIEMPHVGYWKARAFPQSYKWFRPDWIGAQHYVYPTPGSLRRLLEECGFEGVRFGRGRYLRRAVLRGRRGRTAETLRSAGASLSDLALAVLPGLRKTMAAVARRK